MLHFQNSVTYWQYCISVKLQKGLFTCLAYSIKIKMHHKNPNSMEFNLFYGYGLPCNRFTLGFRLFSIEISMKFHGIPRKLKKIPAQPGTTLLCNKLFGISSITFPKINYWCQHFHLKWIPLECIKLNIVACSSSNKVLNILAFFSLGSAKRFDDF